MTEAETSEHSLNPSDAPTRYTDEDSTLKPDPDTIKMFVGQIPRHWVEKDCLELFTEFGKVYELNVLRDKASQQSRGCCFVTFYKRQDAINAQNALHNIRILPQMNHPVQMKPADVENRNERKLFIGMLSKTMTEDEVREMFKEFGQIEECTVLREDGKSRGCAFVTFVSRSFAHQAIKAMHQSMTCEGCNKPIVVKFADTQRDKENKTKQPSSTSPPAVADQNALLAQLLKSSQNGQNNNIATQLMGINTLLQQPGILNLIGTAPAAQLQLNAMIQQQKVLELLRQNQQTKEQNLNLQQVLMSQTQQQYAQLPSISPQPGIFNGSTSSSTSPQPQYQPSSYDEAALLLQQQKINAYQQLSYNTTAAINPMTAVPAAVSSPLAATAMTASIQPQLNLIAQQQQAQKALIAAAGAVNNGQSKGPDGANLFIYHLPQDFTDANLYQLFHHFGTIISAKVFIDKQTNLSKCFGFISYDNALSAQNAISAMNGFQINQKRLKVQLKRSKGGQPYPTQSGGQLTSTS
uniref:Protein alan shepard n=1 Tax=Bursaphelenchus xylophilus TaxID=6326 RepID=A0A1I7S987_BURXY